MNDTATEANKLWGIYHTDREYARTVGDPLRTVVKALTKLAAEEAAAKLGFGEPWAHPVSRELVNRAEWLPQLRPGHRQELAHKKSRGVGVWREDAMIQPTQREIAAAIRVLESLRQSIDAADSDEARKSAPETSQELHLRLTKSRVVERHANIEESVAELRRWAQELSQPQNQTCHHGNTV